MSAITIRIDGPTTVQILRQKISAFVALTGDRPDVWVYGYFDTATGGEVFAKYTPVKVSKIMRKRMVVIADGEPVVVSGEIDSFKLSNCNGA